MKKLPLQQLYCDNVTLISTFYNNNNNNNEQTKRKTNIHKHAPPPGLCGDNLLTS